jgi:hypothetical protein
VLSNINHFIKIGSIRETNVEINEIYKENIANEKAPVCWIELSTLPHWV